MTGDKPVRFVLYFLYLKFLCSVFIMLIKSYRHETKKQNHLQKTMESKSQSNVPRIYINFLKYFQFLRSYQIKNKKMIFVLKF